MSGSFGWLRSGDFRFSVSGEGGGASEGVVLDVYFSFDLLDERFGVVSILEPCEIRCKCDLNNFQLMKFYWIEPRFRFEPDKEVPGPLLWYCSLMIPIYNRRAP